MKKNAPFRFIGDHCVSVSMYIIYVLICTENESATNRKRSLMHVIITIRDQNYNLTQE